MMQGRDIVCLSFVTWDDHWGTPQQIMSRMAKNGNRVLFVDQPISPLSFLTRMRANDVVGKQFKRWREGQRAAAPNVIAASPPPILPLRYNRIVNRINAWIMRRWLKKQVKLAGFNDVIFWNFQPCFPKIGDALDPIYSVYHCVDDFSAIPVWWAGTDDVINREAECCRESDVVICTGRKLVASRSAFNPNAHFVPEGADIDLFATAAEESTQVPDDIAALPGKVIGYIGVIDFRLDVALIEHMAKRRPDWSIALVGPVKEGSVDLAGLRGLPNVVFFGNRPIDALPSYIKAMDVCLIPYVLNDYTHHIFPLKLYEYMAAGKPIVATDMEEMRPYAGPEMTIAQGNDGFLAAVEDALRNDSPAAAAARQATASSESWDSRVEAIERIVGPVLPHEAALVQQAG
jgi:glycosyltransferase involved in cell wall biosynthesis